MAGATVVAQPAVVGILLLVTAAAAHLTQSVARRTLLIRGASRIGSFPVMTGRTDGYRVGTGKRKICVVMIEQIGHQSCDIGVATKMFTMTLAAFAFSSIRMSTMKTFAGSQVIGYRFMAVQTQLALGIRIENIVAV